MTTEDAPSPQETPEKPMIHTDEDWKDQVKAQDAALDARLKSEAQPDESDSEPAAEKLEPAAASASTDEPPAEESPVDDVAEKDVQLPPANFEMLIGMFSTQAMVALGIIPNPATGKAEKMPNLARHFIDLLGVLETRTAGNLEPKEKSALDASLHQLRMAYVEVTKK